MKSITLLLFLGLGHSDSKTSYFGQYIGPITDKVATVDGIVYAVDKSSIIVTNFTHDGSDPGTFIYAGTLNKDGSYTKTGYPLTNVHGVVQPLDTQVGQLLLQFPEGKSLYDVDWIGVLSRRKKKMIGRVLVSDNIKRNLPQPKVLGPLVGRGAFSGDVVAIDSRTLMVKNLIFGGNQPETYFMVGSGGQPSPYGVQIADEEGSMDSLGMYKNRTVILSLPPGLDLRSLSWLSIWSQSLQSSFADISIPRQLNVPPAISALGVSPQRVTENKVQENSEQYDQSKLNCEVLSREVGLQVRWSLAGEESVILQIVGNLGSEMYMAFGVKEKATSHSPAQGDVVVGWINGGTGRGGLDDYFLSGAHTCADGAESCPDTSKPGGKKNVEMLNSVSRDNYTMITFKRPLKAEDIYDTSILRNEPQEVFWSVGYKKAEMRVKHKPLRNADPIFIDFGRIPEWNCPVDENSDGVHNKENQKTTPSKNLDDLDSEPSIHSRRKYKGKRRKVVRKTPVNIQNDFQDYRDTNYDDYSDYYDKPTAQKANTQQNAFTKDEIAIMKKKYEEKLQKDFPKRRDGQKTTLELIPELNTFVEPFFPKGPPPGARPPPGAPGGPPPGPATHPPPGNDESWMVPSLGCNTTDNTVFYLQVGPAAAGRGNQGLGQFGQAWYVNGDIAPDLYLVRGQQYTFIVEGGLGTDQEGIIHPFYLTSDNEGGYGTKSDYEARMEEIYGGLSVDRDGLPVPAIMGRLCLWRAPRAPPTYATYSDFKSSLQVSCQETGKPGVLRFSPDYDMPSVMYYQSFSEKLVGGKIHLLEQCHETLKSSAVGGEKRKYQGSPSSPSGDNYNYSPRPQYNAGYQTRTERPETSYRKPKPSYGKPKPSYGESKPSYGEPKPTYTKPKTETGRKKKKCPRRLDVGMPQFEHFPVRDILKEGVEGGEDTDCQDVNFGGFDDWSLENDAPDEYDDYVQPTRKPLIFKELINNKPLGQKKPLYGYENNEIRRKDPSTDSPFDKIPDLPPMNDNFPNLFSSLPTKYGDGFFKGFEDNFSVKPLTAKVERVVPVQTTYKPKYTATPSPQYDRSPTTPKFYDRTPNTYDRYAVDKKPTEQKKDIEISNSGNSGVAVVTPRPPRTSLYSPSPYSFYTPRPKTRVTPTPYEFYSPTTSVSRKESLPESLPPPDNFPSLYKKPDRDRSHGSPPQLPHHRRQSPLQSLLNPFKNIFSFGGARHPNHPKGNLRRHYNSRPYSMDEVEEVPEPLPPPVGFPEFKYSTPADQISDSEDYDLGLDSDKRRRRRKRPRRPLFDETIKQNSEGNNYNFKDLMSTKSYPTSPQHREPSRRPALYRKRPVFRAPYLPDMDYSPSDKEEILTTALTTQPMKTTIKAKKPSSLGVGVFNPGGIEPESGFVPVMPSDGNTPSLAFSIFDEEDEYEDSLSLMDRTDYGYDSMEATDRGNVVVDIPAQVLPYMPRSIQRSLYVDAKENKIQPRNSGKDITREQLEARHGGEGDNSADFHSFETVAGNDGLNIRKVHDIKLTSEQLQSDGPLLLSVGSSLSYGPNQQGSRVAVGSVGQPEYLYPQMLKTADGTDLAFGNTANYGKQHPSFIQQALNTRLGAGDSTTIKKLEVSNDVVYGKVSETPTTPIKAIEEVDERLLEKLSLLEESGSKNNRDAIVSDLWSIMDQNGG